MNRDDYAFLGEVIKLNLEDYLKMQNLYPYLDLNAELCQLDDEIAFRDKHTGKKSKWFGEVHPRLNGRNKIAMRNLPKSTIVGSVRSSAVSENLNDRSWANEK